MVERAGGTGDRHERGEHEGSTPAAPAGAAFPRIVYPAAVGKHARRGYRTLLQAAQLGAAGDSLKGPHPAELVRELCGFDSPPMCGPIALLAHELAIASRVADFAARHDTWLLDACIEAGAMQMLAARLGPSHPARLQVFAAGLLTVPCSPGSDGAPASGAGSDTPGASQDRMLAWGCSAPDIDAAGICELLAALPDWAAQITDEGGHQRFGYEEAAEPEMAEMLMWERAVSALARLGRLPELDAAVHRDGRHSPGLPQTLLTESIRQRSAASIRILAGAFEPSVFIEQAVEQATFDRSLEAGFGWGFRLLAQACRGHERASLAAARALLTHLGLDWARQSPDPRAMSSEQHAMELLAAIGSDAVAPECLPALMADGGLAADGSPAGGVTLLLAGWREAEVQGAAQLGRCLDRFAAAGARLDRLQGRPLSRLLALALESQTTSAVTALDAMGVRLDEAMIGAHTPSHIAGAIRAGVARKSLSTALGRARSTEPS